MVCIQDQREKGGKRGKYISVYKTKEEERESI